MAGAGAPFTEGKALCQLCFVRLNANVSKIKPCNVWAQVGSKKAQRHLKAATLEEKYPSYKYTATTKTNEPDVLLQSVSLTDATHFMRLSKEEDIYFV